MRAHPLDGRSNANLRGAVQARKICHMGDVISRTPAALVSTKAAAVLLGVKENRVRQLARDLKIGKLARRVHRRSFGPRDLLFVRLTANIPVPLTRELERDLYEVVVKG